MLFFGIRRIFLNTCALPLPSCALGIFCKNPNIILLLSEVRLEEYTFLRNDSTLIIFLLFTNRACFTRLISGKPLIIYSNLEALFVSPLGISNFLSASEVSASLRGAMQCSTDEPPWGFLGDFVRIHLYSFILQQRQRDAENFGIF